jgi:drug/metabolite transporter (DMT)-like permease
MGVGHAAVLLAALIWGTNHVATRALGTEVPLLALTCWRWAIALAFMVPIAWPLIRRDAALLRANAGSVAAAGLNGMGGFGVAISAAPYYTTAANVSLISSTSPLWVLAIAAATRSEPVRGRQVAGICAAFAGAAHIVFAGDWRRAGEMSFAAGDLIAVASAVLWAVFSFQLKRVPREIHPLATTTCAAVCGFGLLAALYLIWGLTGHPWLRQPDGMLADGQALSLVVYIAIGPSLLGNLAFIAGVQRVGAATAGVFALSHAGRLDPARGRPAWRDTAGLPCGRHPVHRDRFVPGDAPMTRRALAGQIFEGSHSKMSGNTVSAAVNAIMIRR